MSQNTEQGRGSVQFDAVVIGRGKQYDTCPKHKFWKDESTGVLIRLKNTGSSTNFMTLVSPDGKKDGLMIVGVNVHDSWVEITESEFNEAYEKAL